MRMTANRSTLLDKGAGKSKPLYLQIRQKLADSILADELRPGQRLPNVTKLVREWNVHPRTIKSALDLLEQDGLIRQEPRRGAFVAGVEQVTQTSMLFVRWSGDPLCVRIAEGVQQFAHEVDVEVMVVDARQDHRSFTDAIAHPPEGTAGLLIMPFDSPAYRQAVRSALDAGLKVVFVDRVLPGIETSAVTADHFAAGYRVTRHLIETHQRPVHYVGSTQIPSSCHERCRGWAAAMQEHNFGELERFAWELPVPEFESCQLPFEDIFDNPRRAALRMFAEARPAVTCVHASNDYVGKGVYLAAEQSGLRIGRDVFVGGSGGLPICQMLEPPLTSVYQDGVRLGYEAARLLHQELTGAVRRPMHRVLPVELQVRQSSTG